MTIEFAGNLIANGRAQLSRPFNRQNIDRWNTTLRLTEPVITDIALSCLFLYCQSVLNPRSPEDFRLVAGTAMVFMVFVPVFFLYHAKCAVSTLLRPNLAKVIDMELNQNHFKQCGIYQNIPDPPNDVTEEELYTIAQRYHTTDSPYSLKNMQTIINSCKPNLFNQDSNWTLNFRKNIRNIVHELLIREHAGEMNEIVSVLASLSQMASWCYSQYTSQSSKILQDLKGDQTQSTVEGQALQWITQFRNKLITNLSKAIVPLYWETVNPHVLNHATYQIHPWVRIPGGESAYSDISVYYLHPASFWDRNYFPREFFRSYTKKAIVDFFDELINGMKPDGRSTDIQINRDEMIEWFRHQAGDEQTIDFFEFRQDRTGAQLPCLKREAIEYFLHQIGVFL